MKTKIAVPVAVLLAIACYAQEIHWAKADTSAAEIPLPCRMDEIGSSMAPKDGERYSVCIYTEGSQVMTVRGLGVVLRREKAFEDSKWTYPIWRIMRPASPADVDVEIVTRDGKHWRAKWVDDKTP